MQSSDFLYRIGASEQRDSFILKGAMLFIAWQGHLHRPTKDVDLLAFGSPSMKDVATRIRLIVSVAADDGIAFEPDNITTEMIAEEAEYQGVRARLDAHLDQARIRMQIDVGFGDAVQPEPIATVFPTILERIPPPVLRLYPAEVVIAEKLHAMVILDIRNSRMKDFYDIAHLARTQSFNAATLRRAVASTFQRRRTPVPSQIPFALTDEFLRDAAKVQQWRGFLRRLGIEAEPELAQVGTVIAQFLEPVFGNRDESGSWSPGGPWR